MAQQYGNSFLNSEMKDPKCTVVANKVMYIWKKQGCFAVSSNMKPFMLLICLALLELRTQGERKTE